MAENTNTNTATNTDGGQQNNEPSIADLTAQLMAANAERDRYKAANDKLSKSEAEIKRQLRAKMDDAEREAADREAAQKNADEELTRLKSELNHIKAVSAYKDIAEEKTVNALIKAVSESDHNAIAEIVRNEIKTAVKKAETEWLKSRPGVGAGTSGKMTVEQIMAIADYDERQKAIWENRNLFE